VNPELAFFEWFRCPQGYRIANARDVARAARDNPETYPDEEWIVPNSDERVTYRCPMDHTAPLVTVFAQVNEPDKLLRFVKQYGPIANTAGTRWGDPVATWVSRAQRFRELLLCKQQGPRKVADCYKAQMYASYLKEREREREEEGRPLPTDYSEMPDSFWLIGSIDLVPDSRRGVRLRLTTDR
jgi:hypothetical protein